MTELQKQVQRAQRLINFQSFLSALVWSMAICFGIAAIGLGIRKIWFIDVDARQWTIGWLAGASAMGLISSVGYTWWKRKSMVEAAIEIDRRFGLRERVSSSLSLSEQEADSQIGRALVADASKRVQRIDVREKFGLQSNRWALLPFATGALALAMVLIPDAVPSASDSEVKAKTVEVEKVKKSTTALKKKLAKKSEELSDKDLPEAAKLAKKLEQGINKLSKGDGDKKKTLVEMNDLAKMLRQRRDSMKGSEELRKKLNQLKDMKVKDGPADQLAKALKDGDFKAALDQVMDLQQQLRKGNLSRDQQQKLAQQMDQMQKKLQQLVKKHEEQKEQLKKQIEEQKKAGNKAAAQKLQQKLAQMQAQDQAMKKMQQMAQQMEKVAQNMQQGNQQEASQQLADMAQDLQSMKQEMEELQAMEDMMDQLADAKDAMNCEACNGDGCTMCQGMGGFGDLEGMPGMGMGEGQGRGDRPEEKTDSNFYDSKVRAKPRRGQMVVVGNVRGQNKPGDALEAIKEAMEAASTADESPLTNVRLPRAQREQAQQYFDAVRSGK